MFGITGGRKQRCRQANRGGGELWFWGVAPRRGHVSNFGDVPTAWGQVGLLADAGSQTTMTRMWEAVSDPRAKGGSSEDSRRRFSCEVRSLPPERTGRQTHFPGLSAADASGLLCPSRRGMGKGRSPSGIWIRSLTARCVFVARNPDFASYGPAARRAPFRTLHAPSTL